LNILQQFLLSNAPTSRDQKISTELKSTLDNLKVKLTEAYRWILIENFTSFEEQTNADK
jgi:hypothetical protein